MSNSIYTALNRQQGLAKELSIVANNLANTSTTGYKTERAIFAEYLVATGEETPSLSMGGLAARDFNMSAGALKPTGGQFDMAIQGDGFFSIETPQGQMLTRAGHFQLSEEGQLVDARGNGVLNAGGGGIQIPPEAASVSISADGTISADGQLVDQVGVFLPNGDLSRVSGTYFTSSGGVQAIEAATIIQGALEGSNTSPVIEMARMIEVQRAYESGQNLLDSEEKRITQLISALRER